MLKSIFKYIWEVLIWIDQGVNVLIGFILNTLFVKEGGAKFGDADETLSSVMGKNSQTNTCKVCSWVCKYILDPIDPKHCHKSIEDDEGSFK